MSTGCFFTALLIKQNKCTEIRICNNISINKSLNVNSINLLKWPNNIPLFSLQGRYNVLKTEGAMQKLGGQKSPKDLIFYGFGLIFLENHMKPSFGSFMI